MVNKQQKVMDLLNLLPDPCSPSTIQIRKIAKEVGCTECWAWNSLSKFRKLQHYTSSSSLIAEYKACLHGLYRLMKTKMKPITNLLLSEKNLLFEIEKILDIKNKDEKDRLILEKEVIINAPLEDRRSKRSVKGIEVVPGS